MNELIKMESINPLEVFSNKGLDPVLEEIKAKVREFEPDMTTDKGRKEIASLAAKVAKSKTYLDGLGKDLVSGWKTQAKVVDSERKRMRDELDALKVEARKPLTDFENKEKERVAKHQELWQLVRDLGEIELKNKDEIKNAYEQLLKIETGAELEEFQDSIIKEFKNSASKLERKLGEIAEQEKRDAELAALRAEQERREKEEREKKIAEDAKREAEEESKRAIERAEKAEREKEEAEKRAEQEKIDTRKREEAARIKAEEDKKAAELRAIEQEKIRAANEKKKIEEEAAKREADTKHRGKINREAAKAIEDNTKLEGENLAKDIVRAIAKGLIPHVKIEY